MGENTDRVPLVTEREQISQEYRDNYDRIADTRGGVRGPFSVLLNSPDLGGRVANVGTYIRYESELSDSVRETAILTTAREFECAYEWAAHEPLALDHGVSRELIEAVASQTQLTDVSDLESLVVEYGRQLFDENGVSSARFTAVSERLGIRKTVELTATMGYYAMLACMLNAFEIMPDSGQPDFA